MKHLAAILAPTIFLAAVLAGCAALPRPAKGTMIECERPGLWCPLGYTCGGDPHAVGCPDGSCCYIGTGDIVAGRPARVTDAGPR